MKEESGSFTTLFLDANVLISAAWKEGSEIAQIWQMEGVRLITSDYVMGEVLRNLHQTAQAERLRGLMRIVRVLAHSDLPEIAEADQVAEKDRKVLAAAVRAEADHLISGDKKHIGHVYGKRIRGVRITAPSELLAVLRRGHR